MHDVEFDLLAFFKSFVTVHLNSREVNEHVATLLCFNETVTFFCVEPFYFTLHVLNIPFIFK